ncbi:hypothetical protein [Mesonia sp. K7]|uniref:hypothetical protein n=1 Tax=Mesonia sp. K7 TaxID=2218606 RepID=UPI000DA8B3DA|nr:hypothetical protein [Mesonia sp. K7]PZD79649.1 hypothetical protein DNG35_01190 [Mesonia sp. K7]
MNPFIKVIVVVLNLTVLFLAIKWYFSDTNNYEPLIILITQCIAILTLTFEKRITNKIKKSNNIRADFYSNTHSTNIVEDVEDSDIKIKNEK